MSKETGGPAFPSGITKDSPYGMTLRDYFAVHLTVDYDEVVELASRWDGCNIEENERPSLLTISEAEAQYRYLKASAMINQKNLIEEAEA